MNSCRQCKHLAIDGEGPELPQFDYLICTVTTCGNLLSFPFDKTKCKKFEQRDRPLPSSALRKLK